MIKHRAVPDGMTGMALPCHFILEFLKNLRVFSGGENFLRKVDIILPHYQPYLTVYQTIPIKNHDISLAIVNFSRNVQIKQCSKKNNRLMCAKIGQKVRLNKLIFSSGL